MAKLKVPEGYIRITAAARILGVDPQFLRQHVRAGEIRSWPLGEFGSRVLLITDVEALAEQMKTASA